MALTDAEQTQKIVDQHNQLRALLSNLEGSTDVAAMRSGLEELSNLLQQHFEHEQDGLPDVVQMQAPRLTSRLQPLLREHKELLATVRSLIDRAEGADVEGPTLQKQLQAFSGRLRAHEDKENELLQDALVDDLGSAD